MQCQWHGVYVCWVRPRPLAASANPVPFSSPLAAYRAEKQSDLVGVYLCIFPTPGTHCVALALRGHDTERDMDAPHRRCSSPHWLKARPRMPRPDGTTPCADQSRPSVDQTKSRVEIGSGIPNVECRRSSVGHWIPIADLGTHAEEKIRANLEQRRASMGHRRASMGQKLSICDLLMPSNEEQSRGRAGLQGTLPRSDQRRGSLEQRRAGMGAQRWGGKVAVWREPPKSVSPRVTFVLPDTVSHWHGCGTVSGVLLHCFTPSYLRCNSLRIDECLCCKPRSVKCGMIL